MDRIIDVTRSVYNKLNVISEEQASALGFSSDNKGWSFINVYYLDELRNVYLALAKSGLQDNLKSLVAYCSKELPFKNKPWTYRKVEEYVNALKNFGVLNKENELTRNVFIDRGWHAALSDEDRETLMGFFYSYYRFREIHSWFLSLDSAERIKTISSVTIKDLGTKSNLLFSFSDRYRFKDAFITELKDNTPIFYLDSNSKLDLRAMRFWDVYLSWGRALGLLEVFSLEQLNVAVSTRGVLNCCYHLGIKSIDDFNLYSFLRENYGTKKVFIPEIVFYIATSKRMKVQSVKDLIVKEYDSNRNLFTLDNTSEIFIKKSEFRENEVILYPLYRDSYISHIKIIK